MTVSSEIICPHCGHTFVAWLTKREEEILNLLVQGYINRQIGEHLGISEQTVKNRVTNILVKLDSKNRTEATVKYLNRKGILGKVS